MEISQRIRYAMHDSWYRYEALHSYSIIKQWEKIDLAALQPAEPKATWIFSNSNGQGKRINSNYGSDDKNVISIRSIRSWLA